MWKWSSNIFVYYFSWISPCSNTNWRGRKPPRHSVVARRLGHLTDEYSSILCWNMFSAEYRKIYDGRPRVAGLGSGVCLHRQSTTSTLDSLTWTARLWQVELYRRIASTSRIYSDGQWKTFVGPSLCSPRLIGPKARIPNANKKNEGGENITFEDWREI